MSKIRLIFHSLSVLVITIKSIVIVQKVKKSKNVEKSVASHCFAIKRWRKLFSIRQVVFQIVTHVMFHLNKNCQKQKHFRFSNVRYRRRSIVKKVQVLLVISICLLHQQNDNSCKMQHENTICSQVFTYVGCHVLSLDLTLISLGVHVGLILSHRQKCHLCCGHPQLTGPLQDFTCILLGGVKLELVLSCHLLPCLFHQFFSVTSESLSCISLISSSSKHCLLKFLYGDVMVHILSEKRQETLNCTSGSLE
jgi:hypothetical protein